MHDQTDGEAHVPTQPLRVSDLHRGADLGAKASGSESQRIVESERTDESCCGVSGCVELRFDVGAG